ncbi:MAG: CDP-glucose 4,6-dehydratase [Lachnospiraceae bacterium]|nr:CDP-glucose 4,6-dehydratase [Lachnospiraceae bacterium]
MDLKEFYKNKRVFITGHTGFKGAWMTYLLTQAGAKVTGYSLEPPTYPNIFDHCRLYEKIDRHVIGDIRDADNLQKIFDMAKPEIVIHMAAQPIVRTSYEEPRYTYDVNVMGTVNILECCRKSENVKSVVNVTTDKVYKNNEWEWGYRENEELNGFDPYSNSKSCSELVTSCYNNSFLKEKGIAVSTARAGNVIGGGDFAKDRIIPDCIRAVENKEDIIVRNPYSTRPFQHVLEPVCVYLMMAMKQYENMEYAGCYNVGPDEGDCLNTGKLVELFCSEWNKRNGYLPRWVNVSDGGPHEAGYLKLDCSKLKRNYGWSPVWDIYETMERLVEWYSVYLYKKQDIDKCMKDQVEEFLSLFDF